MLLPTSDTDLLDVHTLRVRLIGTVHRQLCRQTVLFRHTIVLRLYKPCMTLNPNYQSIIYSLHPTFLVPPDSLIITQVHKNSLLQYVFHLSHFRIILRKTEPIDYDTVALPQQKFTNLTIKVIFSMILTKVCALLLTQEYTLLKLLTHYLNY